MTSSKPRLGILALMLENYESLFPGFIRRQHVHPVNSYFEFITVFLVHRINKMLFDFFS